MRLIECECSVRSPVEEFATFYMRARPKDRTQTRPCRSYLSRTTNEHAHYTGRLKSQHALECTCLVDERYTRRAEPGRPPYLPARGHVGLLLPVREPNEAEQCLPPLLHWQRRSVRWTRECRRPLLRSDDWSAFDVTLHPAVTRAVPRALVRKWRLAARAAVSTREVGSDDVPVCYASVVVTRVRVTRVLAPRGGSRSAVARLDDCSTARVGASDKLAKGLASVDRPQSRHQRYGMACGVFATCCIDTGCIATSRRRLRSKVASSG